MEVAISDSFPAHAYAALDLLDRASKKGQLPVLIEALYRGKCAHLSLQAGGNDLAQLKIPYVGIVTASEKYTIAHSNHVGLQYFALKWTNLPVEDGDDEDTSSDVNYRGKRRRRSEPKEGPPDTAVNSESAKP
jgi:hypothetical protein